MPVLKVKLNGTWVEIDGVSGHTHDVNDITNLPTSLPANGGNADTLDGKHASNFATSSDLEDLKTLVGDEKVSEQISTAIQGSVANWSQTDPTAIDYIKNKPSTVEEYGITELPVNLLSGVIPIEKIPHGALERCVVVLDSIDRFALTKNRVQTGDTVKEYDTGRMYFVINDEKLDSEDGYEVYTTGTASSVYWSGVIDKPATLSGYGITDAVNSSDVVTTATANKILKLNGNGILPANITGNADTVDGKHASDFVAVTDITTTATANKLLKLNADKKLPADITGNAASASKVEWSGIQNVPAGLNNLFTNNMTILTLNSQYGNTLPAAGNPGRIFFKKVSS